jgi:putative pyruvate formate lyase activating enzyme
MTGSEQVLKFLAEEISQDTYLNLLDQYRPCFRARDVPELARPLRPAETDEALALAHRYGLSRLDKR